MSRKLTYETVYEQIRDKVKAGVWRPGERIPPLEELAREFAVGVSSVREAVRILGKQHILRMEQGRGTFVAEQLAESPARRFDMLAQASMVQLTEARLLLEPELAAMAADRATVEQAAALEAIAAAMAQKVYRKQNFLREDIEFHELIAVMSGNEVLSFIMKLIGDLLTDSRRTTMKWSGMNEQAASYHVLIAAAISRRNADQARQLMRSHVEDMLLRLRSGNTSDEYSEGEVD